jgi:hypothetical protein
LAKSSGITSTVSVDDGSGSLQNISTGVLSFDISTPRGSADITGLDKSAVEKILLLADGTVTLNMQYDPTATTGTHTVFRTMSSTNQTRTVTIVINSTPSATLSMEMICTDYTLNRGADGNLTSTATLQLQSGTAPTWS